MIERLDFQNGTVEVLVLYDLDMGLKGFRERVGVLVENVFARFLHDALKNRV